MHEDRQAGRPSSLLLWTTLGLVACSGGSGASDDGGGESEGESESEAESEAEGEAEAESDAEAEAEGEGDCVDACDDGVDCTEDRCEGDACTHIALHGRCSLGRICDADVGCTDPPPCRSIDDCPPHEDTCIDVTCEPATATCAYGPIDRDGDEHGAQICEKVGGDDCDDDNADTYPGALELCDDEDNNCDGQIDEDYPCLGEPCDGPDTDLCLEGVLACMSRLAMGCTDEYAWDGNAEFCNGLDDDCDGETDEDFRTVDFALGEPCDGADSDACLDGVMVCAAGRVSTVCEDDFTPLVERCNGEDDNCDGSTDEGLGGGGCVGGIACIDGISYPCEACPMPALSLGCGDRFQAGAATWDSLGTDLIDAYGPCGDGLIGQEILIELSFPFGAPEGASDFILETDGDGDLDLVVLDGGTAGACFASNCLAIAATGSTTEEVEVTLDPSHTYYVAVENPDGTGLGFSLSTCVACANSACDLPADCWSCPEECPEADCAPFATCGDGICGPGEDCRSCEADCGCAVVDDPVCGVDGVTYANACELACADVAAACAGECPCPPSCDNGRCEAGEDCSTCPDDCGGCPESCGNGTCVPPETCDTCIDDCGACPTSCGNSSCNFPDDCASCPDECGGACVP